MYVYRSTVIIIIRIAVKRWPSDKANHIVVKIPFKLRIVASHVIASEIKEC